MMGWRKASVPKKNTPMLMRAAVLADENEIPDNHVLTVRDRVLSTDLQRIVQNNVKTDTVTLDLDGEWDGCTIYVTFNDETSQSGPWSLEWKGQPLTVPSAIGAVVGPVAVSVVGYGSDGELRLVTEAAPALLNVVKSGYVEIVDDNEENKDILSQMVAAGKAAEDAAETANTAATSATSAASSANSAASSANTAASSANSAATKANAAAVDAQNAYDTLQPYMATIDSCANILHREVGPDSVVTADDSFPCKPVEMTVYGNTVQNLWVNPSGASRGVTVTSNSDGTVTVSGTATFDAYISTGNYYNLRPGGTYTLSVDKIVTNSKGFYVNFWKDGSQTPYYVGRGGSTLTSTFRAPDSYDYIQFGFSSFNDATVSGTYRVMLNEGGTAEPWCPPGLNSVGQLREDEKNLWVNPSGTIQGQTCTPNDDGSFTISGVGSGEAFNIDSACISLTPGKRYMLSVDRERIGLVGSTYGAIAVREFNSSGMQIAYNSVGGKNQLLTGFTVKNDTAYATCAVIVGENQSTGTYKVMLNEGFTAQPWVAPGTESAVQVVTAGKNLFTSFQDTFQIQGENISNQVENIGVKDNEIPIGSKVIFSFDYRLSSGGGSATIQQSRSPYKVLGVSYFALSGDNTWHKKTGSVVTLDIDDMSINIYQLRLDNITGLLDVKNFQLELGSTATDYEPPNITTTPIDLQGHTLNALPDGTRDELHIDGGGNVVLEKRVHRTHVEADGFSAQSTEYSEMSFGTGCDYADGIKFASSSQKNDFAPVGNADAPFGNPRASVYTINRITYFRVGDGTVQNSTEAQLESIKSKVGTKGIDAMWKLAYPQTIDLGTITPPTMAAPNVTAYVADDTPAEMALDYVRDVNIVHTRLEERVAALELASATS